LGLLTELAIAAEKVPKSVAQTHNSVCSLVVWMLCSALKLWRIQIVWASKKTEHVQSSGKLSGKVQTPA